MFCASNVVEAEAFRGLGNLRSPRKGLGVTLCVG